MGIKRVIFCIQIIPFVINKAFHRASKSERMKGKIYRFDLVIVVEFMYSLSCLIYSPEIYTGVTLIPISLINFSDTTSREENADERWIVTSWPVFDGEDQWICIMLWWIGKFEIAIHGDLAR